MMETKTSTVAKNSISEISNVGDVLPYLSEGALLVLDIDDTIITSSTYEGSISWIDYLTEKFVGEGFSQHDAFEKAVEIWQETQSTVSVQLIEEDIHALFERANYVVGCTSRPVTMLSVTMEQLQTVGISFGHHDSFPIDTKTADCSAYFSNGIIFGDGGEKGELLFTFLHASEIYEMSSRIIMIDDSLCHLEEVLASCRQHNVDYYGFRYSRCDHRLP